MIGSRSYLFFDDSQLISAPASTSGTSLLATSVVLGILATTPSIYAIDMVPAPLGLVANVPGVFTGTTIQVATKNIALLAQAPLIDTGSAPTEQTARVSGMGIGRRMGMT